MKFEVEVDGIRKTMQLDQSDDRVVANLDDRDYRIGLARPEDGVYLLFVGARVYEARVRSTGRNSFSVKLGTHVFSAEFIDRKHRRSGADGTLPGQQHLVAPMPGKVIRVLASRGDEVTSGQGLVVVEAMKMQNEVKSPKTGRLVEIKVKEGDTVTANQILAIVE
jgi:biotin carboxyl carrier protein